MYSLCYFFPFFKNPDGDLTEEGKSEAFDHVLRLFLGAVQQLHGPQQTQQTQQSRHQKVNPQINPTGTRHTHDDGSPVEMGVCVCVFASPTNLLPHLGMPTVWMMYTATWKKNTKKKKKKLKELSDLREGKDTKDALLGFWSQVTEELQDAAVTQYGPTVPGLNPWGGPLVRPGWCWTTQQANSSAAGLRAPRG